MFESPRMSTINMKSILELLFEKNEPLNKTIAEPMPIFFANFIEKNDSLI